MLVSGNAFGAALLLVRNLIVARLVSPEQYGIAATYAIAMSIVEMLSYIGLNQLIVVDGDGDDPHVQKALQGFQLLRGLFSSLCLFLIAHPYARLMGVEDVAWAYQVIAVIPLMNGLKHFDVDRLKRHMNFRPAIVASAVPPLVAVLTIWPIALVFDDHRIMLVSLFVQAAATVVLSHATAERRFALALDLAVIRRAAVFGWPLLLNGILLFGVFNGERIIVGNQLGMAQLAVFSMSITLTLTPTLVLSNSFQSLFLPRLSQLREDGARFQAVAVATVEAGIAIGVVLVLGIVLVGGPVVHLLLGPKYAAIMVLLVPMAVLQAARVAKTGASTVALSRHRSGNAMAANLVRVLSLPLAWYAVSHTGNVLTVIAIGILAETVGFGVSLYLAARRARLALQTLWLPSLLTALACIAALWDAHVHPPAAALGDHLRLSHFAVAALCLLALASMGELRRFLLRRFLGR
ncbi:MAG: hypothetical protein Kow0045_14960 [Albidovulum sp.]